MIIFTILMIVVLVKLIAFAISLSWGFLKILFSIILFPLTLLGMALGGLLQIAIPLLAIYGLVMFFTQRPKNQ